MLDARPPSTWDSGFRTGRQWSTGAVNRSSDAHRPVAVAVLPSGLTGATASAPHVPVLQPPRSR